MKLGKTGQRWLKGVHTTLAGLWIWGALVITLMAFVLEPTTVWSTPGPSVAAQHACVETWPPQPARTKTSCAWCGNSKKAGAKPVRSSARHGFSKRTTSLPGAAGTPFVIG